MNINWKLKSAAFRIMDRLNLHKSLYFLQKYVTRRSQIPVDGIQDDWERHNSVIKGISGPISLIEFGAGKTLRQNIFLYYENEGGINQTVVDIFDMLDLDLCQEAVDQIAVLLGKERKQVSSLDDLRRNLSIDYLAPYDLAERCDFSETFDLCVSTNTLEHIPEPDIIKIFDNLKKALKAGAIISAIIDYTDHYSHTDSRIGQLNFLKYSEQEWSRHNSSVHYQNRMRHQDYRKVFADLGFSIEKDHVMRFTEPDIPVDRRFDAGNVETFALRGWFVLRR